MTLRDNFLYFILLELGLLGYLINDIILKKRAVWMRSTDAVIPYMWAVNVMYQRSYGARPAWGAGPGRVAVAVLCLRRGSHARAHRQQGSHDRAHLAAGSHDVIPLRPEIGSGYIEISGYSPFTSRWQLAKMAGGTIPDGYGTRVCVILGHNRVGFTQFISETHYDCDMWC